MMEGSPNGMAPHLKCGGSNPLQVRVLHPPPADKYMPQVLDLRKKAQQKIQQKRAFKKDPASTVLEVGAKTNPLSEIHSPPQIQWQAQSFHFNPQKRYLSLIIAALTTGGVAMLFLHKDTLTAIFLLLSSLVLMLYSNKRPEISKITINQVGIEIGEIIYYYKDLKSFWINYEPGSFKELSLESRKWYLPYVKVSIDNKNPLVIRSLLINFLAEKEHEHSLVDIIARRIGL